MDKFVNLHVHTDSSALDGLSTKEERLKHIISLKQSALAITDHGTMSGIYEFWTLAQKYKVKPLLGVEAYFVEDLKIKQKKEHRYHAVLLAKNLDGFKNIMQLQYIAHRYGFYNRPRMDRKSIEHYAKDIICLTACQGNDIARALVNNDIKKAQERLKWYLDVFGDDFYIEFEPYQSQQLKINIIKLYKFWKKFNVPAVITADAHYIRKEQADDHAKLLLVSTNGKIGEQNNFQFSEHNLYLHSREEIIREGMSTGFDKADLGQWCDTTLEVADKINIFDIKQPNYIVPPIPEFVGQDLDKILREKCIAGLRKKKLVSEQYLDRLAYELKIIYNAGFSSYFLVVADIVNWAKSEGIFVGPSRGSGGGSIISYALNITTIDPLKYNLQFERFLNPERLGGKVLKFLE